MREIFENWKKFLKEGEVIQGPWSTAEDQSRQELFDLLEDIIWKDPRIPDDIMLSDKAESFVEDETNRQVDKFIELLKQGFGIESILSGTGPDGLGHETRTWPPDTFFNFHTWKNKWYNSRNLMESVESNSPLIVVYFGGFKPPHKGHLAVVEEYLSMSDVEAVYILFGDKQRSSADGSVVIGAEQAKRAWNLLLKSISSNKVILKVTSKDNPMAEAAEMAWDERLEGKRISPGFGEKEPYYGKIFSALTKAVESRIGPPMAKPVLVPTVVNLPNISATKLREAIAVNDLETVQQMIPLDVSAEEYVRALRDK